MSLPTTFNAERWQKVKALLDEALERNGQQRAAFLAEACAGDDALRAEVESLLSYEAAEAAPAAAPPISEQIGAYRLLRELGQGGMGTVYLAERADAQYRQQVALKLIRRGMDFEHVLRRFRNERQILAALNHPNIARLLDGGQTARGLPYLVMEYIEGQPLDVYCRERALPTGARLALFRQICGAVHYAHQHLVIHRDLKPSNILVTPDGVPKLLDFGIAKLLTPELAAQTLHETAPEQRLLTPAYASPEQVKGEPVTTASDVYSLGVLLYEMLTGRTPYRLKAQAPHELLRAICEDEPEKPSTAAKQKAAAEENRALDTRKLRRELAGDLDNIVLMALRKEPARRYASVEQLSEDLRRYLAGLPVSAHQDSLRYRAGKFIRRNKAAVAVVAFAVLALLGGIVATTWQARVAQAQRVRAERRFDQVRQLATSFLTDFDDQIYKLPGATPARQTLVKKALETLDSLAQEAGDDPSLQRELATAYQKVGDVQGNPLFANLGDRAGSGASYRKAVALGETIVSAHPQDAAAQQVLAESYKRLGDMAESDHDLAGARDYYRKAIALHEALPQAVASMAEARRALALLYNLLGTLQGNPLFPNLGDLNAALESYKRERALREALLAAEPQRHAYRHELAQNCNATGDLLKALGDVSGAEQCYRRAIELNESLVAERPADAQYRRALSIAGTRLARLLDENNNSGAALLLQRRSAEIAEALLAADQNNQMFRRDLNIALNWLGTFQARSGDPAGALVHQRRALVMAESVSAANPANPGARSDVATTLKRLGDTQAIKGDAAAATQSYQQAIALLEKLSAANPGNKQACAALASCYVALADLNAKSGNHAAALALYRKALPLRETAADTKDIAAQRELALLLTKLGTTAATLAEREATKLWPEACGFTQRSLSLWRALQSRIKLGKTGEEQVAKLSAAIARCEAAQARAGK